ncbi:MAG: hypothetical protein J0M04_14025 [Verrucomicrobia bacterium]|nr:hypothetical protein [Verrucomicrobiota bacterium]
MKFILDEIGFTTEPLPKPGITETPEIRFPEIVASGSSGLPAPRTPGFRMGEPDRRRGFQGLSLCGGPSLLSHFPSAARRLVFMQGRVISPRMSMGSRGIGFQSGFADERGGFSRTAGGCALARGFGVFSFDAHNLKNRKPGDLPAPLFSHSFR